MRRMHPRLRLAFNAEISAARRCTRRGQLDRAFRHLETAHVLGQRFVLPHVQTHWQMLKIGWRRRSPSEIWGQAVRMVLGALGSAVGVVPTGNTGGTDISMFARLSIEPQLMQLIDDDRSRRLKSES